MAVAILLNNWFHDLSVALLTCGLLALTASWRASVSAGASARKVLEAVDRTSIRVVWAGGAGIALFGIVRVAAFREYEWLPAAGKGILVALAVKHVVLASAVALAAIAAVRARVRGRAVLDGTAG